MTRPLRPGHSTGLQSLSAAILDKSRGRDDRARSVDIPADFYHSRHHTMSVLHQILHSTMPHLIYLCAMHHGSSLVL